MKVREFIDHLENQHEIMFYDTDQKRICSCESDSVIIEYLSDWEVERFKAGCYNPKTDSAGLKIVVKQDFPF